MAVLGPIQEDPALVQAEALAAGFATAASAIRQDPGLSDLARAQQVVDAYDTTEADRAALLADLRARQQARVDELAAVVPIGPDVPADASAADKAVILQAWRVALNQAREASWGDLTGMFTDAQRFDDDTMRRAVLTVAYENSRVDLVEAWAESFDMTDELVELAYLRGLLSGQGFDNQWVALAFFAIPRPPEAFRLPGLRAAQQATQAVRADYYSG